MPLRRRPRRAPQNGVASLRSGVESPEQLLHALERAVEAGHLSAYLLRPADLKRPEVSRALAAAQRPLVIPLGGPQLLPGALDWLRTRGGLQLWTTLYGQLEQLQA